MVLRGSPLRAVLERGIPTLLLALLGVALVAADASSRFDAKLLDLEFGVLRKWAPRPLATEVVVVGIDDDSASLFPEPIALWHSHFARLFGAIARGGPSAIGVDLVLPEKSYDAVRPGSDRELAGGILAARLTTPFVLALTVDPAGRVRPVHPAFLAAAGPAGTGLAVFPLDPDGVVRRFDERLGEGGARVETFVGQLARGLGREPGSGWIDFARGTRLAYLPVRKVLEWDASGDRAALSSAFAGRPVLVGTMFQFDDWVTVPVPLSERDADAQRVAGVLAQAQTLANVLGEGLVRPLPRPIVATLAAGMGLLWLPGAAASVVLAIWLVVGVTLFATSVVVLAQGGYLPVTASFVVATLALGGRYATDTILKLTERRRLRESFSRYVSAPVMAEILSGRIRPGTAGSRVFVCVLFSDIRGYTSISERMSPEDVVGFLNRYFDRVVRLVHGGGGSVVSFLGDGIMAVFGAPQALDNPCQAAFDTSRAMLAHVDELNRDLRSSGEAPLAIGIGLNAGEAVLGHVGGAERHDFTAIGDVVNVASRLEGLTKEAGYRIVLSSAVAERLQTRAGIAPLGPLAIKGHSPVDAHGHDRA